jgi:hypothetical protein
MFRHAFAGCREGMMDDGRRVYELGKPDDKTKGQSHIYVDSKNAPGNVCQKERRKFHRWGLETLLNH